MESICNERNKTASVCDNPIVYIDNLKESTKKVLELIHTYILCCIGYNITYKSLLYFYRLTMNTLVPKLKLQYHLQLFKS